MTQPNEDVVRAASAAFGRGDMGALRTEVWTHSSDPAAAAEFWS